MANDMDKKLKDLQDVIAKKSAELKELRQLEKAYYIAAKLEKKTLGKGFADEPAVAKNTDQN